jgi:hypothetical protein
VAILVLAASTFLGGSLRGDDRSPSSSPLARPPVEKQRRPASLDPRHPSFRPEFDPAAIARGEADELDIAKLDADWSHGIELRATVDRTEFRQHQRIRVVTRLKNTWDRRWFSLVPCSMEDHYLGVRVRVFDTNGKLVPMTEYYKHEGSEHMFRVGEGLIGGNMGPDRDTRTDVIPNLVYDMTRPGEYWILVERECGAMIPPAPKGKDLFYVRAKPIKVKVKSDLEALVILPDGSSIADPDRP